MKHEAFLMWVVGLIMGGMLVAGIVFGTRREPIPSQFPEGTYFSYVDNFDLFEVYNVKVIDGTEYHVLRMIRADFEMPPQGAIFGQLVTTADIQEALDFGTIIQVKREHTP